MYSLHSICKSGWSWTLGDLPATDSWVLGLYVAWHLTIIALLMRADIEPPTSLPLIVSWLNKRLSVKNSCMTWVLTLSQHLSLKSRNSRIYAAMNAHLANRDAQNGVRIQDTHHSRCSFLFLSLWIRYQQEEMLLDFFSFLHPLLLELLIYFKYMSTL